MSGPTLIDALRRKAKDDAAAIWQKVNAGAETHRSARDHELEEQRRHDAATLAETIAELESAAAAGAERTARQTPAAAKAALAERLRGLALEALPSFRNDQLLGRLAAELAACEWQRVTVNPADRSAAMTLFPRATVVCDPAVAGGIDAETDEGRLRVTNTLEARLLTAWPDILPDLMKDIMEEVSHS